MFGLVDGATRTRKVLAVDPATPFIITGLPVGNSTLYVCAVDTFGAQACEQQTVTVSAPATDFKVADALAVMDVSQLEGARDVGVMAAGAQGLQSLAAFANAAALPEAEKAQVQAAVAAKTSSMIGSLAKNISDSIEDPNTMAQVVSSVATLTHTSSSLSKDAKSKLAAVGKAGIAAAKLSRKPLTPEGASRLMAVLATGSKVSAAPVTVQASRRLLQEANATTNATNAAVTPIASPTFVPAYLDAASTLAGLLLQTADPGTGWTSGGDMGVFFAAANLPGRSYQGSAAVLAVGPVLDAAAHGAESAASSNVVVSMSGELQGTCENDAGVAMVDSSCLVSTTAVYSTDTEAALAPGYNTSALLPYLFQAISGAVTLAVAGQSADALPCATPGCVALLRVPVLEAASPAWLYQCFQVVDGQVDFTGTAVASPAASSTPGMAGETPSFSCAVRQTGTYIVGRFFNPSNAQGQGEVLADYDACANMVAGQPVSVAFEFGMAADFDYASFFSSTEAISAFKDDVRASLVHALALPASAIDITNVYKGSIVVEITIASTDLNTYNHQLLLKNLEDNAVGLFDGSFVNRWGITGVTSKMLTPAAAKSNVPAIVGGVVGGVGGAAVLAGVSWWVIKRRRGAGIEPRNGLLTAGSHDV